MSTFLSTEETWEKEDAAKEDAAKGAPVILTSQLRWLRLDMEKHIGDMTTTDERYLSSACGRYTIEPFMGAHRTTAGLKPQFIVSSTEPFRTASKVCSSIRSAKYHARRWAEKDADAIFQERIRAVQRISGFTVFTISKDDPSGFGK